MSKRSIITCLFVALLLLVISNLALSEWKVIYTTTDDANSDKSLGYKPLKLYKGVNYAVVVKIISGNPELDLMLLNPGDRLVSEGTKKEGSILLMFKPELTETDYKIVVKNRKGSGRIRLTLAHE